MTAGPLTRRRIVAAIDGAALSSGVIAIASAAAPMFDANVEAVHVVEAEPAASQARQIAADAGVTYHALTGPVLPTLVTYLTSPGVAVVVAGASNGRRADVLLGRCALALAAAAQRPMIIAPVRAKVGATLHRVLVPLDASSLTRAALKETVELARAARVEVVALHVHPYHALPMFTDQPQHELPAWSDEFLRRYWPGSTPLPRLLHRVGVPADEIARAMDETDADMLVLAWSRDLSPGRARIVARALRESRPVLLLPIQPQRATVEGRDLPGIAYRGVASAVA
jgi:nucleotide-binding universal stress UspA family protein